MPYAGPLENELTAAATTAAASREKELQLGLPETLFHYTNASGALGILQSSEIWATDYRYLNDLLEVNYARALFNEVVEQRIALKESIVVREFLSRTLNTVDLFGSFFDLYVACFCAEDDLLNQWRVYSSGDVGYSLGFEAKFIGDRWGKLLPNQDFYLRKVLYDRNTQRSMIAEVLDLATAALEKKFEDSSVGEANLAIASCCQFVRAELADCFMCFKDEAFAVEKEWRICAIFDDRDRPDINFRNGAYGITPYVRLDISPQAGINAGKLPLKAMTVGPCIDPENRRIAISKLLRKQGYNSIKVNGSNRSIRV